MSTAVMTWPVAVRSCPTGTPSPHPPSSTQFAVVMPDVAVTAALRVPERVRAALRIHVYSVTEDGAVSFVGGGIDPVR
jgi:hypothetical protein